MASRKTGNFLYERRTKLTIIDQNSGLLKT
ncbi:hypothetical protein [Flavobacterium humidisoli]